jgi:septation ring formation regulator EzrA
VDNYAEFIERLDGATATLTRRKKSLGPALDLLTALLEENQTGVEAWTKRLNQVDRLLASSTTAEASAQLHDLHDIARRMQSLFRLRAERVSERFAAIHSRHAALENSLQELRRSKLKLESSRLLAHEREKLNQAMRELSGAPGNPIAAAPDPDMSQDIKDARQAVILAEALLEAKGD